MSAVSLSYLLSVCTTASAQLSKIEASSCGTPCPHYYEVVSELKEYQSISRGRFSTTAQGSTWSSSRESSNLWTAGLSKTSTPQQAHLVCKHRLGSKAALGMFTLDVARQMRVHPEFPVTISFVMGSDVFKWGCECFSCFLSHSQINVDSLAVKISTQLLMGYPKG